MKDRLTKVLKDTSFEDRICEVEELETAEEVIEYLRERITEEEVIYYSRAMDYLHENDNSLTESIGIAIEMGCTLENINSELLATLLTQRNLEEELSDLESDIEEAYEG